MQDSLFGAIPENEAGETLDDVNAELLRRAAALAEFKERIFIFGEGRAGARVAVVGESPGPPDIESGRPFMGPAGQMLEKILLSIGLRRADCYLTNAIKVISQGDEITTEWLKLFAPYLQRELRVVRPRVVISFGNTPTRALLNTKQSISKLRGEFHEEKGLKIMPTFNPAYLLRDPTKKREVWEDMKKVKAVLAGDAR